MKKLSHTNLKLIKCSMCNKDISTYGTPKIMCSSNYELFYGKKSEGTFNEKLKRLFAGMLCQECAKKDLEVAHAKAVKSIERELYNEVVTERDALQKELNEEKKYKKFFGLKWLFNFEVKR